MDWLKFLEQSMSMDEAVWQRHSNPWSVYSRFTALPLLSLAFWSREYWGSLAIVPIAVSLFWIWLNPRIAPAPTSTHNWASMCTFGERIYLNRKHENIPQHHLRACRVLQALSVLGVPLWIYGIYSLHVWALVTGVLWIMVTKAWFTDRMVWLYLDMKDTNPVYQSWLK